MNDIIVIGVTHHNTLTMVRCLGKAGYGIDLYIYGDNNSYIRYSKYVTNYTSTSNCEDVFDILKSKRSNSEKPIVISCCDEVAHCFDIYYDELKDYYHFFNAGEKGRMTHFMDKQVQVKLAEQCGLCVPKSYVKEESVASIQFDSYPCICKPLSSIAGQKSQICICQNQEELNNGLKGFGSQARVQVQEFVKREYEIVVVGLRINGETIIPGFIRKLRDRMGGTTFATIYPVSKLPKRVTDSVKRFIKEVNYEGLFGMELIYAANKYYFVETNLRNDATTFAFSVAGVNLPLAYVKAKLGEDYHVEISKNLRQINSMVELTDITHVMKLHISLYRWFKDRSKCESLYFYDKEDMKPYRIAKQQFVMGYVDRVLHKLHLK